MKKYLKKINDPLFILIIVLTIVLRLVNLGYSDYQGDEIKALFLPQSDQSTSSFLLDQRKGPIQFVVTLLVKAVTPDYSNEFVTRLPFAVAGILSIFYYYKLIEIHFNKKIAFYSSFFLTTNGFFIAFSRIAQYQSFVILFDILALYFLTLAIKREGYAVKGIYFGLIAWAISILSHYDGIFIAPFAFWLIYVWYRDIKLNKKVKLQTFIRASIISTLLLLLFYIPFVVSISDATRDYWSGRITGNVSSKISSSKYLFTVYQPIYVVHIYSILLLLVLGSYFVFLLTKYVRYSEKAFIKINKWLQTIYSTELFTNFTVVLLWFIVPVLFFEKIVYISGTHIYTYLLPTTIILAFGILFIEKLISYIFNGDYGKVLKFTGITMVFSFIFLQQYMVFVDNSMEYPWENEKFLVWTLPRPSPIFHLSMFGFPYYRNWEGIKDFTKDYPDIAAYSTNERKSIVRFYVPLEKSSDKAGFFIYIDDPQSFTNEVINKKPAYWVSKYDPVYTLEKDKETLARVYIMSVGSLDDIILEGF